jgi:hypothetical protein
MGHLNTGLPLPHWIYIHIERIYVYIHTHTHTHTHTYNFFFFCELRASCLLGRTLSLEPCPPTLQPFLVIFKIRSCFMHRPAWTSILFVLSCVAGMAGAHHHAQPLKEMEPHHFFALAGLKLWSSWSLISAANIVGIIGFRAILFFFLWCWGWDLGPQLW